MRYIRKVVCTVYLTPNVCRQALELESEISSSVHATTAVAGADESEAGAVDIQLLALRSPSPPKRYHPALQAGDTIEYECEVSHTCPSCAL